MSARAIPKPNYTLRTLHIHRSICQQKFVVRAMRVFVRLNSSNSNRKLLFIQADKHKHTHKAVRRIRMKNL